MPAQYVFGNSGRNILRGPSLYRVDLALVKSVQLRERTRLELQLEAYNAFNHANLSLPTAAVDSSTAGKITGVTDIMRRLQLSVTLRF